MWDSFIEWLTKVNDFVNGIVWGVPAIVMILGTGILLTARTGFMQVRRFKESIGETIGPVLKNLGKEKPKNKGKVAGVSQFEAFSAAISGTVGTGNIVGVVSAILTGGPGAVFWMWISAFFGMITNYAENVLGLFFRKRDKDGNFSGGAFYYITYGLKQRWLGIIAALVCMLAAVGMSGVQANKITGTLTETFNNNEMWVKLLIGGIIALLTAIVVIGGIKRIGKVASMLVPFMSILFMILSVFGILRNFSRLPEAVELIFASAFNFKAMAGGFGGYMFSTVIRKGMARGVFSNEAGLGSSVIAHSASETREPVKQGLWGIFEVFFDTFVICTLTALLFLTSVDLTALTPADVSNDAYWAMNSFTSNYGTFGQICYTIILPLFAFTTILAWSYYGEKATEFLFEKSSDKVKNIAKIIFKVLFVLLIVASAVINSDLVWALDDTFNGLMALPNLVAVILLSGLVVKITVNYYQRKKGIDVKPMLSAYPEMNEQFIKDLEEIEKEDAIANENGEKAFEEMR